MAVAAVAAARKIREDHERAAAREAQTANDYALTDSDDDDDNAERVVPLPPPKLKSSTSTGSAAASASEPARSTQDESATSADARPVPADSSSALDGAHPAVSKSLGAAVEVQSVSTAPKPPFIGAQGRSESLGVRPEANIRPTLSPGNSTVGHETPTSSVAPSPGASPTRRKISVARIADRAAEVHVLEQKGGASVGSFCADIAALLCAKHDGPSAGGAAGAFRLPRQRRVARLYASPTSQITVAVLILANFIVNAIEAQMLPAAGGRAFRAFLGLEYFFNACFSVELLLNMYAHFLLPFWKSAWNVFDVAIVLISWLSMFADQLPGIGVLRLFRAFRVFRLFKRVESLRRIIEGVVASLTGVANAFVVLGILMGIWSIIGVEFFGKAAPQHFGNFVKAMFTMWQVMTGDGGYSGIARHLLYDEGLVVAVPFFLSYGFVAGIVMTNVVIAILLDAYLRKTAAAADGTEGSATARRAPLRERLWLLARVLRSGKAQVALEIVTAKKLQRAVRAHIARRKKARDLPNRRAMRALAAVISSTVREVFSERALGQLSSRERLGLLATLWSSRLARAQISAQKLHCSEKATFLFAKLTPTAAVAHVLLVRLGERAEEKERKRQKEEAAQRKREGAAKAKASLGE